MSDEQGIHIRLLRPGGVETLVETDALEAFIEMPGGFMVGFFTKDKVIEPAWPEPPFNVIAAADAVEIFDRPDGTPFASRVKGTPMEVKERNGVAPISPDGLWLLVFVERSGRQWWVKGQLVAIQQKAGT